MASSTNQIKDFNDPSGLVWVTHSGTDAVPDAVYAGKQANGQEVYVARAILGGSLKVGKFVPGLGGAFLLDYGPLAAPFQVLTNPKQVQFKWALAEPGKYPPTAVLANNGITYSWHTWNKYYIGRTKHQGNTSVGYVLSSDQPSASVVGQPILVKRISENKLWYRVDGISHHSGDFEILLAKAPECCQCPPTFTLNCSKSYPKKMK